MFKFIKEISEKIRKQTRPKKKRGLRYELECLRKNIAATDHQMARMESDFWANGGVCCPCCGCEGYSELQLKQERREARVGQIIAKLKKFENVDLGD